MLNPNRYYDLKHRSLVAGCPTKKTLEELQLDNEVAFRYHDYVITGWYRFNHEDNDRSYSSAIYQYDGSERNPDTQLTLVYLYDREFEDMGDAIRTAIERAVCIHAERMMKKEV